jgi:hypothetical protein
MIKLLRRSASITLVLLSQIAIGQGPVSVQRSAAKVTLSNGQIVTALSTFAPRPTGATSTVIFMGSAGNPVVFTQEADAAWNQLTLSVADGSHKMVARFHIGYVADGMPGPAELQVDNRVFRWLSKENGEATSQKRAMQKAVAELPEDLRKDLVTFSALCGAAGGELVLPASGFLIPELFAETLPNLAAQSIKKLDPDEVARSFQDGASESSR